MTRKEHEAKARAILERLLAEGRGDGADDVEAMAVLLVNFHGGGMGLGFGCTDRANPLLLSLLLLQCLRLLEELGPGDRAKAWENFRGIIREVLNFRSASEAANVIGAAIAKAAAMSRDSAGGQGDHKNGRGK